MTSDFSKLCEVADVIDSLHRTPSYSDVGKAMLRCTDVKYGKLDLSNTFKVSNDVFVEFSRRYSPKKEDIIITRVGSYGITGIVDDVNFCLGQNTSAIVPNDINPRYLYLALNSPYVKNQIEYSVVGSTQKTLSLKAINNLEIPRFRPEIEDDIARIVGDLDDKIELNRQTNQTLEQIAQAIFKSWFVDFDPVRAKIAAREAFIQQHPEVTAEAIRAAAGTEGDTLAHAGAKACELAAICAISGAVQGSTNVAGAGSAGATKTEEQLAELDDAQGSANVAGGRKPGATAETLQQLKATAALFPDELVGSETVEVPVGWNQSKLGEHFNVVMGQSPKGETFNEEGEGIVFFQGRRDFGLRYPTPRVYTTDPKRTASPGDTLISVRAPVGDRNMAGENCCLGRGVAAIRHKTGSRSFTYAFIGHIEGDLANSGADGTVFSSINRSELDSVPFIAPSNDLIKQFEKFIYPLDQQIEVNSAEISSLEDLRDALLPKLLSGEIDINKNMEIT